MLKQNTAPLRLDLRQAYRLSAAASLRKQYPELSRRFVDLTLIEARETGELTPPDTEAGRTRAR